MLVLLRVQLCFSEQLREPYIERSRDFPSSFYCYRFLSPLDRTNVCPMHAAAMGELFLR
jgi:hypothetical protein